MAIGAGPRAILAMILGQSMRVALAGLVAGGGAAVAASRIIQSEWHGIMEIDGLAFGGTAVLFMAVMLLAGAVRVTPRSDRDPQSGVS